jgi:hypothetical protein
MPLLRSLDLVVLSTFLFPSLSTHRLSTLPCPHCLLDPTAAGDFFQQLLVVPFCPS